MFPDTYMYQAENASAKVFLRLMRYWGGQVVFFSFQIQWLDLIDKTKQHHKAKRDKQRKSLESLSRHDSIHRRKHPHYTNCCFFSKDVLFLSTQDPKRLLMPPVNR